MTEEAKKHFEATLKSCEDNVSFMIEEIESSLKEFKQEPNLTLANEIIEATITLSVWQNRLETLKLANDIYNEGNT